MKTWRFVTLAIVLLSIGASLVAGLTTWLAPALREGVLVLTPTVAAALVLVLYFNWRAGLRSRILSDARQNDELTMA